MTNFLLRLFASVRLRITISNTVTLAAFLIVFGTMFRWALWTLLLRSVDDQMEAQVASVARTWEAASPGRRQALMLFLRARLAAGISNPNTLPGESGLPLSLIFGGTAPDGIPSYPFRLLNRDGFNYLDGSKTDPWDNSAYTQSLRGSTRHTTIFSEKKDEVRVCSYPIRGENGQIEAVAQIARSLQPTRQTIHDTDRILVGFLPFVLLGAGFFGVLMTGRALAPVGQLLQAVSHIGSEDLSQRLPVKGRDEFAQLAQVINGMLQRLEQAFAQQKHFTADASHELRSPLTVILGQASLSLSSAGEGERAAWERVIRAARSMERLVADLLLLARFDARQMETRHEKIGLRAVLQAAVEAVPETERVQAAPIEITVAEDMFVGGDPAHLERAVLNLLTNALRHTPASGEVTLSAQKTGTNAVITVQDTGCGIAPEHLPHLFERFYRVDSGRTRHDGGSGLGLAITKSIVENQGGSVQITSEPGHGTCFRIFLPTS